MGKISFNAGNLGEGGFSEGDATVASVLFEKSTGDYGDQITCILGWQTDEMSEPSKRFYNVGKAKNIMVVDDGASIDVIDDDSNYKISKNSGFGKLLAALENAGFPTARLDGKEGWNALIGEKFHVEMVTTGNKDKAGNDKSIPLPTKYLSGVAKSGKPAAAAKPAAAVKAKSGNGKVEKAEAESEGADADVVAAEILEALVDAADEPLTLKELQQAAFRDKTVKAHPERKAIMAQMIDEEFLALELGWSFDADAGTVSSK